MLLDPLVFLREQNSRGQVYEPSPRSHCNLNYKGSLASSEASLAAPTPSVGGLGLQSSGHISFFPGEQMRGHYLQRGKRGPKHGPQGQWSHHLAWKDHGLLYPGCGVTCQLHSLLGALCLCSCLISLVTAPWYVQRE